MGESCVDVERRRFLVTATSVVGGVGAACAMLPFLAAWKPSARAQAAGAPVEIDISKLEPGQQVAVEWQGKPVWVVRRTQAMVDKLPELDDSLRDPLSNDSKQPEYTKNIQRSIKSEFFITLGICTHLGCVPTYRPDIGGISADWQGGFFCPCHGSSYDMAGRVYRGVPAPLNLEIPKHQYLNDNTVLIGQDGEA